MKDQMKFNLLYCLISSFFLEEVQNYYFLMIIIITILPFGWSMEHDLFLNQQEMGHLDTSGCSSFTGLLQSLLA